MQLEQGDRLESENKDFIGTKIPSYEKIWGIYVGHDGNGRMTDIPNLKNDIKEQRVKFAEHNYTCVESLICMKKIADTLQPITQFTMDAYLNVLNGLMAFHAHAGRIRDNSNKILIVLNCNESVRSNILPKFENIYQQRNVIVHGKRLPLIVKEGYYLIAPPMGNEELHNKWRSEMNWEDFNNDDFEYMEEYLRNTLDAICGGYNSLLFNVFGIIKNIVQENSISIINSTNIKPKCYGLQGPQGAIISGSTINN